MSPDRPAPSEPPSDREIVRAVLDGQRERFGELVDRYQRRFLRVAVGYVGNGTVAEDVVQETFLSAYKSLRSYDARYAVNTWLWTILLNQCRRQLQRQKRQDGQQEAAEQRWLDDQREMETPEQVLMQRERRQQLDRWLNTLPPAQSDALRLRFYGGLKYHEIAEAMQCGLSTAKMRVRWGLQKLAEWIREHRPLSSEESP